MSENKKLSPILLLNKYEMEIQTSKKKELKIINHKKELYLKHSLYLFITELANLLNLMSISWILFMWLILPSIYWSLAMFTAYRSFIVFGGYLEYRREYNDEIEELKSKQVMNSDLIMEALKENPQYYKEEIQKLINKKKSYIIEKSLIEKIKPDERFSDIDLMYQKDMELYLKEAEVESVLETL